MASQARQQSGKGTPTDEILTVTVTLGDGQPRHVVVDSKTMTLMERRAVKTELAKLEYEADEIDMLAAAIWVAMRRDDSAVTFDEVCESLTFEQMNDPQQVALEDQDSLDPS